MPPGKAGGLMPPTGGHSAFAALKHGSRHTLDPLITHRLVSAFKAGSGWTWGHHREGWYTSRLQGLSAGARSALPTNTAWLLVVLRVLRAAAAARRSTATATACRLFLHP